MTAHCTLPDRTDPSSARPAWAIAALLATLLATLLVACGGDPAAPPVAENPADPPVTFAVTASLASIKQLTLAWPSSPADTAHVLEDPDGPGPLPETEIAQVAAASGQASVDIFLPSAINASYRVALCRSSLCVHSEPLTLSGTLEAAMGLIKSEQVVARAGFGEAVALSRDGRVLAVGAPLDSVDASSGMGAPGTGAVHLYEKSDAGPWVFRTRVLAPFPDDGDQFGLALALSEDGSVLAVGAPEMDASGIADGGANNAGSDTGGVFVFKRLGDTWPVAAFVQGSGASDGDWFGGSVDLSDDGETLAVGATQLGKLFADPSRDGKAFVFQDQGGSWVEQALLRDDNLLSGNAFGQAVALSADGNTLAVGDPRDKSPDTGVHAAPLTTSDGSSRGAVHLFARTVDTWARTTYVKAPRDIGSAHFGQSVDLDATAQTLLIGAPQADLDPSGTFEDSVYSNSGAALVYSAGPGGWSFAAMLRAPAPVASDRFGSVVALSGDGRTASAGAYLQDDVGVGVGGPGTGLTSSELGAAYAFMATAGSWEPAVVLKPSEVVGTGGTWHGRSVALSGDGRTLAVGAGSHDGNAAGIQADPTLPQGMSAANSGAVYLY